MSVSLFIDRNFPEFRAFFTILEVVKVQADVFVSLENNLLAKFHYTMARNYLKAKLYVVYIYFYFFLLPIEPKLGRGKDVADALCVLFFQF